MDEKSSLIAKCFSPLIRRLQNKSVLWSPTEDYFNTAVLGFDPDQTSW
jgi:hypothetical protein